MLMWTKNPSLRASLAPRQNLKAHSGPCASLRRLPWVLLITFSLGIAQIGVAHWIDRWLPVARLSVRAVEEGLEGDRIFRAGSTVRGSRYRLSIPRAYRTPNARLSRMARFREVLIHGAELLSNGRYISSEYHDVMLVSKIGNRFAETQGFTRFLDRFNEALAAVSNGELVGSNGLADIMLSQSTHPAAFAIKEAIYESFLGVLKFRGLQRQTGKRPPMNGNLSRLEQQIIEIIASRRLLPANVDQFIRSLARAGQHRHSTGQAFRYVEPSLTRTMMRGFQREASTEEMAQRLAASGEAIGRPTVDNAIETLDTMTMGRRPNIYQRLRRRSLEWYRDGQRCLREEQGASGFFSRTHLFMQSSAVAATFTGHITASIVSGEGFTIASPSMLGIDTVIAMMSVACKFGCRFGRDRNGVVRRVLDPTQPFMVNVRRNLLFNNLVLTPIDALFFHYRPLDGRINSADPYDPDSLSREEYNTLLWQNTRRQGFRTFWNNAPGLRYVDPSLSMGMAFASCLALRNGAGSMQMASTFFMATGVAGARATLFLGLRNLVTFGNFAGVDTNGLEEDPNDQGDYQPSIIPTVASVLPYENRLGHVSRDGRQILR